MNATLKRNSAGAVNLPRRFKPLTDDETVRAEGFDSHIVDLLERRTKADNLDTMETIARGVWLETTGYRVGYGLFLAELWFTLNERPARAYRLFERLVNARSANRAEVKFSLIEWAEAAACEHLQARARWWYGRITIACRDTNLPMPTVTARAMVAVDMALTEENEGLAFASKSLRHSHFLCAARQQELCKDVIPARPCTLNGPKVVS